MRLLRIEAGGGFSLVEYVGKDKPDYAILSHTWGADHEEVTFRDLVEDTGKSRAGYRKLTFCRDQAEKDGLQFFWIDTCCIDKSSSAELTEAINSMFRWYQDAKRCYVLLPDVLSSNFAADALSLHKSKWFTRGWTLQELLAPNLVEFFSSDGNLLGDRGSLVLQITKITGIPIEALEGCPLSQFSVQARLSWLGDRETRREEDAAYCMLGIFDTHMPLIYGEGRRNAFARLYEEIDKEPRNLESAATSHAFSKELIKRKNGQSLALSDPEIPTSKDWPELFGILSTYMEHTNIPEVFESGLRSALSDADGFDQTFVLVEDDLKAAMGKVDINGGLQSTHQEQNAVLKDLVIATGDSASANKVNKIGSGTSAGIVQLPIMRGEDRIEITAQSRFSDKRSQALTTGASHLRKQLLEYNKILQDKQLEQHIDNGSIQGFLQLILNAKRWARLQSFEAINDWLCITDFTRHNDIAQYYDKQVSLRLQGTCEWIFTHPAYQSWISEKDDAGRVTKFLWIHAPAGYGKTVLCAKIVEYLTNTRSLPTAHFFASPHAQSGGEPEFIIRYWLSRMAQHDPDILELLGRHYEAGQRVSNTAIWSLFENILLENRRYTFVLDGFDEYARQDYARSDFLQKLKKVTNRSASRILITSRDETDIKAVLSPKMSQDDTHNMLECKITGMDVRGDVSGFSSSVVDKKLPNKDDQLRQDLADRLAEKCDGMFLWIKLHQDQLRGGKNAKQLQKIVENMPTGLEKTYERYWTTIQNLPPEERHRALSIIRWTTFASRPLTVSEITEALLVELDADSVAVHWDELPDTIDEEYINGEILDICGGLVEVREQQYGLGAGSKTLHFIHSSVRDFLLSTALQSQTDSFKRLVGDDGVLTQHRQHEHLAMICLGYLDCDATRQRQTAQGSEKQSQESEDLDSGFVHYAAHHWHTHLIAAKEANSELINRAKKFLSYTNEGFNRWSTYFEKVDSSAPEGVSTASPLYYAALFNLPVLMTYIHSKDPSQLDTVGGEFGSPLQAVCFLGHEEAFHLLLSWGANPNVEGGRFGVPINAAISGGRKKLVKELMHIGVDYTLRDPVGRTPLYTAAKAGHSEIVLWLAEAGADLESENKNGFTPVIAAADSGHVDAVNALFNLGVDIKKPNNNGETPLNSAAYGGHTDTVKALLEHGADMVADKTGGTPLYWAAHSGHVEIVRLLLGSGADMTADNSGLTPVHAAALYGHLEVLMLLIEEGADINIASDNLCTPLYSAASGGYLEIVRVLLQKGADVAATTSDGWTPLAAAAIDGHATVAKLLLEGGADTAVASKDKWTPLNTAANNGHLEVVKLLLEWGADMEIPNKSSSTPLYSASLMGHLEIAVLLLEQGAQIETTNVNGCTPLYAAASGNYLEIVRLLLEKGAYVDAITSGDDGSTPSYVAAASGHLDVLKLLAEHGADLFTKNKSQSTVLNVAALGGHLEVVKWLLERGADSSIAAGSGWTPLYSAAYGGHLEVVKLLLEDGAETDVANENGYTPLNAAAEGGHLEVVKWLLDKGADIEMATKEKITPLWTAVFNGHLNLVELLIKQGADMTVENTEGSKLIHAAAQDGHTKVVQFLLDRGADVGAKNHGRGTPLYVAAYRGRVELVQLLLQLGTKVDVLAANVHGWTPLHAAAVAGHLKIVQLLLQRDSEGIMVAKTADGWTPLFAAAVGDHLDIVQLLLQHKEADITAPNTRRLTVLQAAASRGHTSVLTCLLAVPGTSPDCADHYGRTLVWWAAAGGHKSTIETLLKLHHSDPSIPDKYGRTPLSIARRKGHNDVVELLSTETNNHDASTPSEQPDVERSSITCDVCTANVPKNAPHYHCNICELANWDLCEECYVFGAGCLDETHVLMKRKRVDGKWVDDVD